MGLASPFGFAESFIPRPETSAFICFLTVLGTCPLLGQVGARGGVAPSRSVPPAVCPRPRPQADHTRQPLQGAAPLLPPKSQCFWRPLLYSKLDFSRRQRGRRPSPRVQPPPAALPLGFMNIIRDPTESRRPLALCPGQVSHPEASPWRQVSLGSQQQPHGPPGLSLL